MPRKTSSMPMSFQPRRARRQGLSQRVTPQRSRPQRASHANPRRKSR